MRKKVGRWTIIKHPKTRVCAIDFDGTLCTLFKYNVPYIPKQVIYDKPILRLVKLCKKLHNKGCKVILHSSRWWGDYAVIKDWLDKNKVPYDGLILGKLKADVYIDDLAVNPADPDMENKVYTLLGFK